MEFGGGLVAPRSTEDGMEERNVGDKTESGSRVDKRRAALLIYLQH